MYSWPRIIRHVLRRKWKKSESIVYALHVGVSLDSRCLHLLDACCLHLSFAAACLPSASASCAIDRVLDVWGALLKPVIQFVLVWCLTSNWARGAGCAKPATLTPPTLMKWTCRHRCAKPATLTPPTFTPCACNLCSQVTRQNLSAVDLDAVVWRSWLWSTSLMCRDWR